MKTYVIETRNFYSGWTPVKSFESLKDATEYKKSINSEKEIEHRIVQVENVTETYERRQMIIERS